MPLQHFMKKDAIYERLKQSILLGHYPAGGRLPSEPELAASLKAGRVTIRAALERLEREHFVLRFQGKGTFVADRTRKTNPNGHYLLVYSDALDCTSSTIYILPGIEQYCAKLNIKVSKMPLSIIRFAGYERALEILQQEHYTGIILLGHCFTGKETELEVFRALKLPVVLPHSVPKDAEITGFATIYYELMKAPEDAVRYLVSQGQTSFATLYFSGEQDGTVFAYTQKEYLDMLRKNGAFAEEGLLRQVEALDILSVEKALKELLDFKPDLSAVFCYSDFCALTVYQICAKYGIRIPEELAVMGFCGYPGGKLLAPSLATIDLQYETIGHMAVEMLRSSDEWFGKSVPCIASPHRLIAGGSVVNPDRMKRRKLSDCMKL